MRSVFIGRARRIDFDLRWTAEIMGLTKMCSRRFETLPEQGDLFGSLLGIMCLNS